MANFYAMYPPSSGSSSNPSVGPNLTPIPSDSTLVAGEDTNGDLHPLQTDASGYLYVSVGSTPSDQSVNIVQYGGVSTTLGQKAMAASIPVTLASDQSALTVNQGTPGVGAWPTLAAQSGTWSTRTQDGSGNTIGSTSNALDVNIKSSGLSNQSINLAQVAGTTTATSNGVVGAGVQRVAIASDNTAFAVNATLQAGSAVIGHVIVDSGTLTAVTAITNALPAGSNVIGHVINDAGSAIIGKVGIDQTTPGTTNAVAIASVGATTIAAGQSAAAASVPVTLSNENVQDLYFTGQSAQTATVNNIIPASSGATATDATGYRSGSIQVVSTGTGGTFIFEGSNDNSSFITIPVYNQAVVSGASIIAAITATNSQLIYTFPINFRYLRLRIATTITGGSIQAFTKLSQSSWAPFLQLTSSPVTANVNAIQSGAWFTTATATLSNVASSASSVTVLASNSSRKGAMIFNDSTQVLYLKFGATASATSYTVQISAGAYYELPASPYMFTGILDGIWAAANGNARVTEIT